MIKKLSLDVYDFDHTIYRGNAMVDFYIFALKKQPRLLLFLPYQALHTVVFIVGLESRTDFKGNYFVFLKKVKNLDSLVHDFWANHYGKVKTWYTERDHSADVIVSASPVFLLAEVSQKLGVHRLIATKLDKSTGKVIGANCYGIEKLKRLKQELPDARIESCYSDSLSDIPILNFAEVGYIVKGDTITPYQTRAR